ncbi:MAG: nuclear transport factor 2 family protein [Rhodospirillaceae bacterium]|jgi:ketosteroid isomerase-like protein|nr:nuclear transport factor 2 family protein [Rhodospirillaceae bacterium]
MRRLIAAASLVLAATMFAPAAQADMMIDEARNAVSAFIRGVAGGADGVAPLLAPEFQIQRANGVAYDRDGYIGKGVGTVHAAPDFALENVVATGDDDIMVVRYLLVIDETIDGQSVAKSAPRLTVFRKIDGQWKVVSHANFAKLG